MGAWGTTAFDNDIACDWAGHLKEVNDLSHVRAAIHAVQDQGDEGIRADLACEVLARQAGRYGARDSYTATTDEWVDAHPGSPADDDLQAAIAVLDAVVDPRSGLTGSWVDAAWTGRWHAAIASLRGRLAAARTGGAR